VRVLVVVEFWEDGVQRKRAGTTLDVSPEYLEKYRPFLLPEKRPKTVTK